MCEALKDNYALALAFNPDLEMTDDVTRVCATRVPTTAELLDQIIAAPAEIWGVANDTYENLSMPIPTWTELREYLSAVKQVEPEMSEGTGSDTLWDKASDWFGYDEEANKLE